MTLTPTGPGLTLALVSIILLALSWVTVVARVIVRFGIKALGSDDYLMVAGLWFMFFQLFYVASTVPIKWSICIAMLRITTNKTIKWALYMIMFLSMVAALTTDIAVLAWCHPVAATWDKRKGTCADASVITNVSYFISSVSILTDWSCAILPAFILWNVQLRFRIKAPVAVVLALGVVASTATLVRLRYLLNYNNPGDYLYGIANIAVWSIIESGTGLIAGSLPALRPLLRYIPYFAERSRGSDDKSGPSGRHTYRRSHKLDTLRIHNENGGLTTCEAGKRNWEELSDAESQKYILKESHVTVTSEVGGKEDRNEGASRSTSHTEAKSDFDRSRY
ncbi:hypothetical protein SLS57_009526 [Botryosphaeria dothidea]